MSEVQCLPRRTCGVELSLRLEKICKPLNMDEQYRRIKRQKSQSIGAACCHKACDDKELYIYCLPVED